MIQKICICGAGTMGSGIAQVVAQAGFTTIIYERNPAILELSKTSIDKNLQALVDKGKLSPEEKEKIKKRLQYRNELIECKADVIIEAIVEELQAKISLFHQLSVINDRNCIFASNTSSLSVSSIASEIKNPERVVGLHFFNPAPVMKLVEVVKTSHTARATLQVIVDLTRQIGKIPVVCNDSPGFIVNRVARPYYIESLRMAEEGRSNYEKTDALMEASGFKMGPFRLMDMIGNDINYTVSCSVYEQLNQPERLKPSFLQKEKTLNGALGRKSGRGYYTYEK